MQWKNTRRARLRSTCATCQTHIALATAIHVRTVTAQAQVIEAAIDQCANNVTLCYSLTEIGNGSDCFLLDRSQPANVSQQPRVDIRSERYHCSCEQKVRHKRTPHERKIDAHTVILVVSLLLDIRQV